MKIGYWRNNHISLQILPNVLHSWSSFISVVFFFKWTRISLKHFMENMQYCFFYNCSCVIVLSAPHLIVKLYLCNSLFFLNNKCLFVLNLWKCGHMINLFLTRENMKMRTFRGVQLCSLLQSEVLPLSCSWHKAV